MFGLLREIYPNCSNRTFRGILPELFNEPNCSPDTEFVNQDIDSICTYYIYITRKSNSKKINLGFQLYELRKEF